MYGKGWSTLKHQLGVFCVKWHLWVYNLIRLIHWWFRNCCISPYLASSLFYLLANLSAFPIGNTAISPPSASYLPLYSPTLQRSCRTISGKDLPASHHVWHSYSPDLPASASHPPFAPSPPLPIHDFRVPAEIRCLWAFFNSQVEGKQKVLQSLTV